MSKFRIDIEEVNTNILFDTIKEAKKYLDDYSGIVEVEE